VKIEAGLNIAEKRLPQDGRITKKIAGKVIDVRVSTIPTAKGERVVMRLLDKEQVLLNLIDLGFARRELDQLERLIARPNGIILVTGPTGSGKTTTLYACLNKINTPEKNILTAEDPVEYELRGIGLRSFLRQDPDVIMVGEIRDRETAEIAIHASLTGHLVLSTLHTNDAPSAITRMVDMDVQAYQISSSVLAVLAQRLVRKLCVQCRAPYRPTAQDLRELGIDTAMAQEKLAELRRLAASTVIGRSNTLTLPDPAGADSGKLTFYHPGGCDACSNTGYRGRIGIFELMMIDEPVRREILNSSDAKTIQRVAQQQGMRLLREDGARQVVAGVTSVEEVLAATQAAEV
jgi:general secretion pathway protein E